MRQMANGASAPGTCGFEPFVHGLQSWRSGSGPNIGIITHGHDTGSTTARSVDEIALIRDTISHCAPVLIAPLSIPIRHAGVQKKSAIAACSSETPMVGLRSSEKAPPKRG